MHTLEFELQVHPAVKKFIEKKYSVKPFVVTRTNPYGTFLYNCLSKLSKSQQPELNALDPKYYSEKLRISMSEDLWRRKGWYINPLRQLDFNNFVEELLDESFLLHMEIYTGPLDYKIYKAFECFRYRYKIFEDELPLKTLEKRYERYRKTQISA